MLVHNSGGPAARAARSRSTREQVQERGRAAAAARRPARRSSRCRTSARATRAGSSLISSQRRAGADRRPRAHERRPARRRRLDEVARERARPEGHHRQLGRARAASTPSACAELYGRRAARRGARPDPAAPARRAARARRTSSRSSARTAASYVSGTHIPVDGGLYRGLALMSAALLQLRPAALLAGDARRCSSLAVLRALARPVEPLHLPARSRASGRLRSSRSGRAEADRSGGIYFVDIFVRKASLIERLWPGHPRGRRARPEAGAPRAGRQREQRRDGRPAGDDAVAADRRGGRAARRRLPASSRSRPARSSSRSRATRPRPGSCCRPT